MWADRKPSQTGNWANTSSQNKQSGNQTPRNEPRPCFPLPIQQRKSITPSKINDRITSSPLRRPLQKAIESCMNNKPLGKSSRRSRVLGKSRRKQGDYSSSIIRRGLFDDDDIQTNERAHTETISFLKRYFDLESPIPSNVFIDRLVREFEDLWGNQNVDQILDNFTQKVLFLFGCEVEPRELISVTRQDGMIGLILQIFKSINEQEHSRCSNYIGFSKNPNVMSLNKSFEEQLNDCGNIQHIKNIIQEFMESMYKEMESQIYGKFNVEMRRMVLKYKDAERILKKIQERLTHHADFFQAEGKWKKRVKSQEESIREVTKRFQKNQDQLKRERQINSDLKFLKSKLEEQNNKLKQNVQKFQNILISKFESLPYSDTSITIPSSTPNRSRRLTSNNALTDRTQQFTNMPPPPPPLSFIKEQPFQIKIDTHFIQRDHSPLMTQTTTTFMEPNFIGNMGHINGGYSPIKLNGQMFDSSRPSYEGGIRPGTKIGDYTYSPYQGRVSRHF